MHIPQLGYHSADDLVEADIFQQEVMYVVKEGMIGIGLVQLFVARYARLQQPGLFELVQLQPYAIRAFPELSFQVPEIGAGVAVEKEL